MSPAAVVSLTVTQARAALIDARAAFEAAVHSLDSADGQTVMASDELLALLARMVAARAHADEVARADRPASSM